jgi:hypothetical protein
LKYDEFKNISKFKCRLIALGYRQRKGIDFDDIYSPVTKLKSILIVLSISVQFKMKVVMLDFSSAFMHADIDNDTYITLPQDLAEHYYNIKTTKQNIFKLKKALYGLHQSPLLWFKTIITFLISLGYQQCTSDVCVLIKRILNGLIIITIYVDDTTVSFTQSAEKEWLADKEKIQNKFRIKDLGDIKSLLKLTIIQVNPEMIIINQSTYIERLMIEYNLQYVKNVNNPATTNTNNELNDQESEKLSPANIKNYQSLIGSLNYISSKTRPDISFSVNQLSRQLVSPTVKHWLIAIRVLIYLHSTKHYGLVVKARSSEHTSSTKMVPQKDQLFDLVIYADAAHGNYDTIKYYSTLGYTTFFNGNLVSWNTTKAKVVSHSSTESEMYAILEASKEISYFQKLIFELINYNSLITIITDSSTALDLLKSDKQQIKTKHMKIKISYLKDSIEKRHFQIMWVDTKKMIADILTKYVTGSQFQELRNQILFDTEPYVPNSNSTTNNQH